MRQLDMVVMPEKEFERFRRDLPKCTKEGVTAAYGISQHSCYKLRDGKPVKRIVVDRLRERYAALVGQRGPRPSSSARTLRSHDALAHGA